MKKIKRFMFVALTCFMAIFTFSGCNLWSLNTTKYLSQTVATFNNLSVDLEKTYNAYYNYGNYYYDGQGTPTLNGITLTATQLINREIVLDYLKEGEGKITLTTAQLNEVWQNVYDSINSSILTLEDQIRKDAKEPRPDASTTEDSTEADGYKKAYAAYEKSYIWEGGELKQVEENIKVENFSKDIFQLSQSELDDMTTAEKAKLAYQNFIATRWNYTDNSADSYSNQALIKYIKNLRSIEKGKNLSTVSEEIFYREMDRLFNAYYEDQLLTVYQENYKKTADVITSDLVLQKFNNLMAQQRENYLAAPDEYTTAMKTTTTKVLYHINAGDWFNVSHVLVKFSDEQTAELTQLKTDLANGKISQSYYDTRVEQIKANTMAENRKTGEKITVDKLLKQLQEDLTGKSSATKLAIFNEYIYTYGMDDGANNAELAYRIPTDSANDSMVTPFANAAREIRKGSVGNISSAVETEYGYHIIMYLGETKTLPSDGKVTMAALDSYLLNPLNNKSMLDYILEQITVDNYSKHETALLTKLKINGEVKLYQSVLEQIYNAFK